MNTWLRADKVNPTLEELQKFKSRREKKEPGASDDSDEERLRGEEDKETELMEDLAIAQAMEPKSEVGVLLLMGVRGPTDVSLKKRRRRIKKKIFIDPDTYIS